MSRISMLVLVYLALLAGNVQCADDVMSPKVEKWQLFESKVLLEKKAWQTDDWNDYQRGESAYPAFSFSYPVTWKFNGSIEFDKLDGSKAEMGPAPIKLKNNQKCFAGPESEGSKYLKNIPIRFGNLSGRKIVAENETDPPGDIWHTYRYCLSNGEFAFTMMFWVKDLNAASERTFDKVMSTFKFETPIPSNSESKSGKSSSN